MGWARKILRIDLAAGTVKTEPLNMEWAQKYLGQRGLATKYLLEEIDPRVDPMSPANKLIGATHYLNSGDWVESMTAILEHHDGTFEVITYHTFCERTNRQPKGDADSVVVSNETKIPVEAVETPA